MIDKIAYSSKLRKQSPCLKSFFAVMTLFLCVWKSSIPFSIVVLFLMSSLIGYNCKISYHYFFHLSLPPVLFALLSTITIIINYSEVPLSKFAIPLLGNYITVSQSGLLQGMTLIFTALGAVSCLYFLALSTPMTDIIYVLKALHCPYLIIELFMLMYRFIFILLESASSMTIAMNCRLSNRNASSSLKAMSGMLTMLFILSIKKAQRLYDGMEARCYNGTIMVLRETKKAGKKEIAAVIAVEVLLLLFCIGEWW